MTIRQGLATRNPEHFRPALANSLAHLGQRLSELGRHAEALTCQQDAVAIYRELTAVNQPRFRADLARALSNLSGYLAKLDRHTEAEQARTEATAIRDEGR